MTQCSTATPAASAHAGGTYESTNFPTSLAAIEIYRRAASAPPVYQKLNGRCGIVTVWTK